jgi:hypothetical protein
MAYSFSQQNIQFGPPIVDNYQEYIWTGNVNSDGVIDYVLKNKVSITDGLASLRIQSSTQTGYVDTKLLFNGSEFQVQKPEILIADFNRDGFSDLAVFDEGIYDWGIRLNLGLTPQLFLGNGQGNFVASNQFSEAIQKKIVPVPTSGYLGGIQTDTTIGIKDVAIADIDRDGFTDIWVECTGSKNMTSHFLINHGSYFEIDINKRISKELFFGPKATDYFRYGLGEFIDVNSDLYPDLFLGQIRDNDISHINQSSLLLVNDGTGNYPETKAIKLPNPDFYYGYTSVQSVDCFDVNRDGLKDLVVLHTRNDDVSGSLVEPAWTGSFFQILLQTSDGHFLDQTQTYLINQSPWSSTTSQHARGITHADLNNDGWNDLLVDYAGYRKNTQLPLYFLNQGGLGFAVGDSLLVYGSIPLAFNLKPVNANNDQFIDFYKIQSNSDSSNLITLLIGNGPVGSGGKESEVKNGSIYDDSLIGSSLNDVMFGNEGNDRIDGGGGIDTAEYDGLSSQFTVRNSGGLLIVTDNKGASGADTLTNIERLNFSDGWLAFDVGAAQNAGQAYRIYKAAFDRAPDTGGLGYWIAQMDQGMGVVEVAARFIDSSEFRELYGQNPSNAEFLTKVYSNVLDRTPDTAGLDWWVNEMKTNPSKTWQKVLADFSESTENQTNVASLIANGIEYVPWVG